MFIFDFHPEDEKTTERVGKLMSFNWAVWKTITLIKGGMDRSRGTEKMKELTMNIMRQWKGPPKGMGKSGKRTQRQRERAQAFLEKVMSKIPKNSIICYTDASSLGNPGPSGAGLYTKEGYRNGYIHKGGTR